MTATLTTLRTRVLQFLLSSGLSAWNSETIDEMLRQALAEYSDVFPRQVETVITCPAAGREIALSALTELVNVLDVWWPYDSTADQWPPNRVAGFRLDWDDGQPLLTLTCTAGPEPQANDEVRLWYTTPHHLDGLDGAAGTTILLQHESLIVYGAAAYTALAQLSALVAAGTPPAGISSAATAAAATRWAESCQAKYQGLLDRLHGATVTHGPAFGAGWPLD